MTNVPEEVRRDHVRRPPLPWRPDEAITECGRKVADCATVIDADQLVWRLKNWGQHRTAFTVCVTCADRARYSPKWEVDPLAVMQRESRRTGGAIGSAARYRAASGGDTPEDRYELLSHELRAMVELALEYPDEFNAKVAASYGAADFARRRQEQERKRGHR